MTPVFMGTVEEHFGLYMQANHPTVPFYFDNSKVPTDLDIYVVFHVLPSDDTLPINLGIKAKSRNVGIVQADVFDKKDVGSGPANSLANAIARAFKRRSITTTEGLVVFKDPSVTAKGTVRGRHKEEMRCAYRYDFNDMV